MLKNLTDIINPAKQTSYSVACINVFGFEDALAVVRAAESCQAPVILGTNKHMVDFAGPRQLATMLGYLAADASVPVGVHLDHCDDPDRIRLAVDCGYSSVMYDGSQLPLQENIDNSREMVEYAHKYGVSVEGEIGSVPYSVGRDDVKSELTSPQEAEQFALGSGVDAVAISIGNVHRLQEPGCKIDYERLMQIANVVDKPLVIHGTSGIYEADISKLAAMDSVCKFNIGTSLRKVFGRTMRDTLANSPDEYDRLTIFQSIVPAMQAEAERHIKLLNAVGRAVS